MHRRRVICIVAWAGCVPALLGHAMLTLLVLSGEGRSGESGTSSGAFMYFSLVCGWFAWYAFAALSWAWVVDQPRSLLLPLAGIAAFGVALAPAPVLWMPLVIALPGVLLAVWLLFWQLTRSR